MFLWRCRLGNDGLEPRAVFCRDRKRYSCTHPTDSHTKDSYVSLNPLAERLANVGAAVRADDWEAAKASWVAFKTEAAEIGERAF